MAEQYNPEDIPEQPSPKPDPYYVPDAGGGKPDPYYVPDAGGGKPDPYYTPSISLEDAVNLEKARREAETVPIPQPGVISGGLQAGWNQLQSSGAGLIGDIATMANLPSLKQWADTQQDLQAQEAAQYGRPDLENIRDQSLGTALPFLGYQVAKQLPLWAGALGVSALTGSPAAGIALAGASGVGEMYGQAREAGIENKPGVALGALGLGVPYGYLETLTPYALEKGFLEGFSGSLGKRALKGFASGFGKESLTEAAQTGLEMAFRPDLPMADKAQNVIDAALTGGVVGGSLGGITGAISKKPDQVTDDDTKSYVDEALGLPPPDAPVGQLPPPDDGGSPPEPQQALPPPPLGLPAPTPVPMGEAPQSIFADKSDQDLLLGLSDSERAVAANPDDPIQAQLLREARAEVERRQAAITLADADQRQQQNAADPLLARPFTPEEQAYVQQAQNFLDERAFDTQTPSFFTQADLDQTPKPSATPVPTVIGSGPTINLSAAPDLVSDEQKQTRAANDTRSAIAKDLLGVKQVLSDKDQAYLEKLNYGSPAEFANTLIDKLNDGATLNKNEKLLAKSYNLLQDDGNTTSPNQFLSLASKLERQATQPSLKDTQRGKELVARAQFFKDVANLRSQKETAAAQQSQTQAAYDTQFANLKSGEQVLLTPSTSPQGELNFISPQATTAPAPLTESSLPAPDTDQLNLSLPRNVSDAMITDYTAAANDTKLDKKIRSVAASVLPELRQARTENRPIKYESLEKVDMVERALGRAPVYESAQTANIPLPSKSTMLKTIRKRYPNYTSSKPSDEIARKYVELKQPKQAPALKTAAPVISSPLSENYINEPKRIQESSNQGAALRFPSYDAFKKFWTSQDFTEGRKFTLADLAEMGVKNKQDFVKLQKEEINKYVEAPAQSALRRVHEKGGYPFMSNAFGSGQKGVWYTQSPDSDVTQFEPILPEDLKQGVPNAVQKSEPKSILSRQPSEVSGPVGEGDTQGAVTTESLQQGNINEESSSQGSAEQSASEESRTNQEGSKARSGEASVKTKSPARISVQSRLKEQVAAAKKAYQANQKARRADNRTRTEKPTLPEVSKVTKPEMERGLSNRAANKPISKDIIKNDKTLPKVVRDAVEPALQAANRGNFEPLNFLYRAYDRVTKISNEESAAPFAKVLRTALETSVKENDPTVFENAYNDIKEDLDLERPNDSTVGVLRSPAASQKTGRMTVEAVKAILKSKLSQWAGLPEVRVVSESDPNLSEADRAFLKQSQVFKGLGAFAWQNEKPVLLLNADKLTPSEVLPTLYHEALGHFGLRSAYGQQLRALLEDLYNTTPSIREAVEAYIKARPDLQAEIESYDTIDADQARIQLVEEVLAEQSEKGVLKQNIFSQLKALVERFARWAGLRSGAFSKDEIMAILRVGQQSALNPSKLTNYYLNQSYLDSRLVQSPLRFAAANENLKDAAEQAKQRFERFINSTNSQDKFGARLSDLRNKFLPAMSVHHMAERYGKILPGLKKYYDTLQARGANINHLAHVWSSVHSSFEVVRKQSKAAAQLINDVMQFTALKLDPSKSFNQQTKEFRDESDPVKLQLNKKRVAEANKLYAELKANPKAFQVYQNFRTLNDLMIHSTDAENLFEMLAGSTLVPAQLQKLAARLDPMEGFKLQTGMESDPTKALNSARDYFKSRADELLKLADAYLDGAYGEPNKKIINPIKHLKDAVAERRAMIKAYPYFHLGRQGDLMISFRVRNSSLTGKQTSSVADRQRVQDALEKAGFKFELALASNETKVFLRVDSAAEQDAVLEVLNKLQKEGIVDPKEEISTATKLEDTLRVGAQPWLDALRQDAEQRFAQQQQDIKESDLTASQKADALNAAAVNFEAIKAYIIDSSPNTSAALVSLHRKNVPGYMSDMVRAGAYRAQVWTLSLANMSSRRLINDAMVQMRAAVKAENSKVNRSNNNSRGRLLESIVSELATREAIRPFLMGRTWHDTVAAWNHSYFLGLSPSYVVLQFTQLGVMLWPRLVQDFKNVSFLDAARTIGRNTPAAIQLVKAMIAEGKLQGAWNWTDAPVTLAALNKTSLTKDQKEFVMRFVNRGNLDVGSAAREQGRIVEGERKDFRDTSLRIAASFGYYSEVATRLIAALSAYELYKKTNKGAVDSADSVAYNKLLDSVSATVDGSMFNYNTTNTARILGKMGFAGPLTRVMMTFYKYTASLLEALSRAIMDGFLNGANIYTDPVERAEKVRGARRFLAAHMTAMMVVSGSLGLPFASAVASAINGLASLFGDDDEPYDAIVAWRSFLASVFGNDIEKILSKGGGRLLGVDFSSRTSEADILPFTKMFADRRSWTEASKEWAAGMFGSPLSMTANILDGATQFLDGDYAAGAQKFVPTFLKGPLKAVDMYTNQAYMDKKDNRIPNVAPGATDILAQAFGFTPSNIQDVKDKDRYYQANQGVLSRRASKIRNNLAAAVENRDPQRFAEWRQQAIEFNRANPTIDILKSLPRVLTMRAKERAGATKEDYVKMQKYPF